MIRRSPLPGLPVLVILVASLCGCLPQQPVYFPPGDGDLSHYLGVATQIEYPDAEVSSLAEVEGAAPPFVLNGETPREHWDLSLEEAIQIALANSRVMKNLGAQVQAPTAPEFLLRSPEMAPTIYDPAIVESDPQRGPEAALAAFDAQLSALVNWQKTDEPQNINTGLLGPSPFASFFRTVNQQDVGTFQAQLAKVNATGGVSSITHEWMYMDSNLGSRVTSSDWTVRLRGEIRQPLLRGAGVQFNRIAGAARNAHGMDNSIPGFNNGVVIARINTDIALADFEAAVRNLVLDVEKAYWELYYAYRFLDSVIAGRDYGLQSWRQVHEKFRVELASIWDESRARQQYFAFREATEQALTNLYHAEAKLRYLMGLAATDGRLIRPADEPVSAEVQFDWYEIHAEALARSVELRKEKWRVKQRELELIAAKNFLLPRLDLVASYQWQGLGYQLIQPSGGLGNPTNPVSGLYEFSRGTNAYQSMLAGDFQNWTMGLEFGMPLGFRKEMAAVRNAQLLLARERAKLQEAELELSHQLAHDLRDLAMHYQRAQTNFNRRVAARDELKAAQAKYEAQVAEGTLDLVLDAQRRLAEAETAYYRSLVDHTIAIAQVHFRKGSLLEYNNVYLAEGPWPAKAYFDAYRRARERDASIYLDYGFTRPKVVSRGPVAQHVRQAFGPIVGPMETAVPSEAPQPEGPEVVPAPAPVPIPPEPGDRAANGALPSDQTIAGGAGEDRGLSGPVLGAASGVSVAPVEARSAAGQWGWRTARPAAAGQGRSPGYDLGSLDLSGLAGAAISKPAAGGGGSAQAARGAERPSDSAVGTADFQQLAGGAGGSNAISSPATRLQWIAPSSAAKPGSQDVSGADLSPAEADRPASGWQRLQR